MLSFLTPEGAPNYRKLIISPKQVALVANGVMDDFFYLEFTPMCFFFVWFDSLRPSQQSFSYVGTGLPGLKDKCVFLKDITLWHRWGMRKLCTAPPSLDTNNICRCITGSFIHSRLTSGQAWTHQYMSSNTWFPTMWHFDMNRLRWACVA